jgi:aminobenzoyl-glutamate utilization protein B
MNVAIGTSKNQKGEIEMNIEKSTGRILCIMMLLGLLLSAAVAVPANAAVPPEEVVSAVEKVAPTIKEVGTKVWEFSELSLLEVKSSEYLKDVLKKNDFKIISEGTANVPTAFVAEYGHGKPVLGIMLEYDALPGLGNEPVPAKEPRKDGVTAGHGCGHNLIGSGALGAAVAIKNLMQEKDIPGTLRVYGGAAEESEGAKVYMARAGVFKDVDAMLHWHPLDVAVVANLRTTALSHMYIEFNGKTAHAGVSPWIGRSALDAVEIFLHSVNMMREHVEPTARIQYIIKNGGLVPNVVPDHCSVKLTCRDADRGRVEKSIAWIKDMAKGAALATQTKALAVDYYGMHDLLPNTPLAQRMQKHLEQVGLPEYTKEEMDYATQLQKAAGVKPTGMTKKVEPLPNEPRMGGATDVGDVSYLVPTMGLAMPAVPEGIPLHTWMATSSHGTSIGNKGAIAAAKVLALTGIDILTDEKLRKEMKADFDKRTEGFVYKSPINEMIKEPVGLPDDMRHFETLLELKESIIKTAEDDQLKPGSDK